MQQTSDKPIMELSASSCAQTKWFPIREAHTLLWSSAYYKSKMGVWKLFRKNLKETESRLQY